jgi:hypothetical protein
MQKTMMMITLGLSALLGPADAAPETATWRRIAPLFQAPAEFRGQFDDYPSPLKFYDGRPVAPAADWPRRRQEILDYWRRTMGPWPALLERPKLERQARQRRDNYTQIRVSAEVAPGFMQPGYMLVPEGKGPFPAVLVVYYDPATSAGLPSEYVRPFPAEAIKLRQFARDLALRGFVTFAIGAPGGDARVPELNGARTQGLSYLAYLAANCHTLLAQQPEVNPARIGVMGHSYGGKWAMFASCLHEKFACAVWSDGGVVFDEVRGSINYWDYFYLGGDGEQRPRRGLLSAENPRRGAYKQLVADGRNLHDLHALMAPRPFLVSGGSEDYPARWRSLNHAVEVNRFLGQTNRVAMHNRPAHPPTDESNEISYLFFEHHLK